MDVHLSDERVASLEAEVKHINNDIRDIKLDVSDIRKINRNIGESLSRLTVIAEENQRSLPMIETLNVKIAKIESAPKRLDALEKWRWLMVGGFAAIVFYVTYGDKIRLFLGS